jgi:hypothetical protein
MKPVILAFLLLLIAIYAAQSFAQPVSKLTLVQVQGNRFVTADGKPVVFRGLNASDPDKLEKGGHWEKSYLAEMKKWGANLVRFPVHPRAWQARGTEEYLKMLDQGVAWAGELGLYVIIDWHSIGNLKTEMYQDPMYQTTRQETYEFWRTVSAHYKDNPVVAFFELFNEPTVMNGKLGACSWNEWKTMNEEMISIIRSTGAKAIPLVAGFNWAYDLKEVAENPIAAEGIAYVSHPYPMKREKPWEDKWTTDWGFVAKKYPVMLTEIGFCGPDDKGAHVPVISDESYGDAITAYADANGISWVVWVFDPQWAPMLFSDWNYTPTRQGRYFKQALQKYAAK